MSIWITTFNDFAEFASCFRENTQCMTNNKYRHISRLNWGPSKLKIHQGWTGQGYDEKIFQCLWTVCETWWVILVIPCFLCFREGKQVSTLSPDQKRTTVHMEMFCFELMGENWSCVHNGDRVERRCVETGADPALKMQWGEEVLSSPRRWVTQLWAYIVNVNVLKP